MPLEGTIVLDSGAFLNNVRSSSVFEVGYFYPEIRVHGDDEEVAHLPPSTFGTNGSVIEVRHDDASGIDLGRGTTASGCFHQHLLHLQQLYHQPVPGFNRAAFHCIFQFNSGRFFCSRARSRAFKEIDAASGSPSGNTQTVRPISHDIVVCYGLGDGEALTLRSDGRVLWTSRGQAGITKRFNIEIIADDTTGPMFYRDALNLGGRNYHLPNQGDPPPMTSP